jgi:KDO2-lipid IV(A) lauroyltransferase
MANAKTAASSSKKIEPEKAGKKDDASEDLAAAETEIPKIKWRHYIEAGFAFAVMAFLRRLSLINASDLGGWAGRWLGPWTGSWRTAKKNLALAMPEFGLFERDRVAREAFDNFGRVMAEYAQLPSLWRTSWDSIVDVAGKEHMQRAVAGKKGAIVFTAHIGNWEIIPMVLAHAGKPTMLVYRAANNPLIDRRLAEIRGLYTAALAAKGADGARAIVDHVKSGGLVYMVVDQKMNTGIEIPFFGVGAMTGKAIARMAMRHGCDLIPARCERLGSSQFRVSFEAPWFVAGDYRDDADMRDALIKLNLKFEEWIRATPGQWLWMHKRWPKDATRA